MDWPERKQIDITGISFENFVRFVFDHEYPDEASREHPWYDDTVIEYEAFEVCEHYIQLFRAPEFLRKDYSVPQLDEGFWTIMGGGAECSLPILLDDRDLPFALKKECIQSMFDLFQLLFAFEPLESAVFMWWDCIRPCFPRNWNRENGGELVLLQDVMFETLQRILTLSSAHCQKAALHGLSHLHHPKTDGLVSQYLKDHPELEEEDRNYALAAARFDVL